MSDTHTPETGTNWTSGTQTKAGSSAEWRSEPSSPFGQSEMGQDRADLRQQTSELGRQAREGARETYEQVRQYTNESLENARRQWSESKGRLAERASSLIRDQKDRLCTGLDGAAKAARAAAEKLEEEGQEQSVAGYARAAVGGLEQVRDYLRAADVNDIADEVRQFTRRHPEWVLGGLFVAGLAMARFMKADRPIGPRPLPEGAEEGLYRDVYRSQFDDGGMADEYGDFFQSPGDEFTAHYGGTGDAGRRPGETGGYNPSGGQAGNSGYQQSYGRTVSDDLDNGRGSDPKGATL